MKKYLSVILEIILTACLVACGSSNKDQMCIRDSLRPFKEHPFQVKDDKEMFLLQESIEKYGILNPLIVRPVPDGYYEIISGHRRKHAAEKLGYRKVPVIIRVLSEDDSILSMRYAFQLHLSYTPYFPE